MIKILVTGDFCPHKRIEQLVLEKKYEKIYNDFITHLENNDINITNLECPLINTYNPIAKDGPNLKAKEVCIDAFKQGNFNLLALSNNHIMDHGEDGLFSTIELCVKNNIEYIGAGKNIEEAAKPIVKKIKNRRIAFLNFSEIEFSTADPNSPGSNPLNPISNYYSIKSARENADYIFVIVHGGHEGYSLPSPRMIETYRFFIDAGADIVIGHHTHCYSGYENYNKGWIFYSLGNFVFDKENIINRDWNYGYAVKFFLDDSKISFEIIPYKQCNEIPGLSLLNEKEKQNFDNNLSKINDIISDKDYIVNQWKTFSKRIKNSYLIDLEYFDFKIYTYLRAKKILPSLLSKKKRLKLIGLIRCESHRDLVIESLKINKK